jgi:hypothetical protein
MKKKNQKNRNVMLIKSPKSEPCAVAEKIRLIEKHAAIFGATWPRWTSDICEQIANQVSTPDMWALSFLNFQLSRELVLPFIDRLSRQQLMNFVHANLESNRRASDLILTSLLRFTPPMTDLLDVAIEIEPNADKLVWSDCFYKDLNEDTLGYLLTHPDHCISSNAASAMWLAKERNPIPKKLRKKWKRAVIRMDGETAIGEILKENADIRFEWVKRRTVENVSFNYNQGKYVYDIAVESLSTPERKELLAFITNDFIDEKLVRKIVVNNPVLFRILLAQDEAIHGY